jgi:hypothetical protein
MDLSFESMANFKHMGVGVKDTSYRNKEFKGRFNSGNACYHIVQNILL